MNFLKKFIEFFILLPIFCAVRIRQVLEELTVKKRFYVNKRFKKCDEMLRAMYFLNNPYRISKRFLIAKGEQDVHVYGETPISTLDRIAKEAGISALDQVVELGCGRGRGVFFLAETYNCSVKGIEWIPEFVKKANQVALRCGSTLVRFSCEDMQEADLSSATIVYLYGTNLDESSILKLIKRLDSLSAGAKVITVSYPLSDYAASDKYLQEKQFTVTFPWGNAQVYVQKKS